MATIPQKRGEEIGNDLLSFHVILLKTLYEDNESIGKVADKEIVQEISITDQVAQYNYACVFAYTNIVMQISDTLQGSVTERIIKESITLFYIELILLKKLPSI